MSANTINQYVCTSGHKTITEDIDKGVTPFIINCPECDNFAFSNFYEVDQTLVPTHEWYRPKDTDTLSQEEEAHCTLGGLLLRKK